jgi:hypothetical protein
LDPDGGGCTYRCGCVVGGIVAVSLKTGRHSDADVSTTNSSLAYTDRNSSLAYTDRYWDRISYTDRYWSRLSYTDADAMCAQPDGEPDGQLLRCESSEE